MLLNYQKNEHDQRRGGQLVYCLYIYSQLRKSYDNFKYSQRQLSLFIFFKFLQPTLTRSYKPIFCI